MALQQLMAVSSDSGHRREGSRAVRWVPGSPDGGECSAWAGGCSLAQVKPRKAGLGESLRELDSIPSR